MRRRLVILRHAKSDWTTDAPDDHSRPLNRRGRKDAPRVARQISKLGWAPEHVLSSDSQRTRETFELMTDGLGSPPVTFLASLYHAGPRELSLALADLPDSIACGMAIGHNPGWEDVVHWLCGESLRLTTANAALLSIDDASSWPDALGRAGFWTLVNVVRPKEL